MYFADESGELKNFPGSQARVLFPYASTDCVGFTAMYSRFFNNKYIEPHGIHDDNEGFFIVSGTGKMLIGGSEYLLSPGCAMFAPAGVEHAIKKTSEDDLFIFLFHFPVSD